MYRKLLCALSLTTALCIPVCAHAEILSDTVGQALITHPQMKAGEASLAAAKKNIQEQKSGFFPVLGIDGRGGIVRANDETTRGATAFNGGASSWLGEGTVRIVQPLYTGFSVENRVDGAKDRESAANHDLTGTAEDIALRAARAHLNLMRTRELLDLASKFLSDIEGRHESISLMVKEGAADAAELLQADEIQAAAKNTRLGYEEAYRQAAADYIEVVGAEPIEELELGEPQWNGMIPNTLDDALVYATAKNARILSAESMVSALSSEAKAERSTLQPRVDAEMSFTQRDQRDQLSGESIGGQAMIKMGWNFSTGGGQIARLDKLRLQKEEAAAKRMGVVRNVERDVRQKYTSMEIVDQQYALLQERQKATEKILENFTDQFEGGKQSNLQLISANSRMFEATAATIDAKYRRLLSRFELLNVTGRLREAMSAPAIKQKG